MPFILTMPKLSPTMEEGGIAKWLKNEGEFVKAGVALLEITTDKATVEHTALDEGWLRMKLAREGQMRKVGEPLAIFSETKEESIESFIPKAAPPPVRESPKEAPVLQTVPSEKKEGVWLTPSHAPEPPLTQYSFPFSTKEGKSVKASPYAKKLAKEKGLDVTSVKGSGPGGRVTSKDLSLAESSGILSFRSYGEPKTLPGTYKEIPLTPMRKVVAKRLQESKSFIPHFYVRQTVHADPLMNLRKQLTSFNLQISFNDMILRACSLALRQHPKINCGFDSVTQCLVQFETIDISVAVSLVEGLITPIVRHADYKNLNQISLEVKELVKKAQAGKLQESEYKGGSFCVSNLGMYGISEFTAVINPPQGAILAVGAIEPAAIVSDGKVVAGHTLTLTMSLDHRVVDGKDGAQFLKTLQTFLENPVSLAL